MNESYILASKFARRWRWYPVWAPFGEKLVFLDCWLAEDEADYQQAKAAPNAVVEQG